MLNVSWSLVKPVPSFLHLTILTPAKVLLDSANVAKVRLKLADDAWLSIYPHHLPLIAEILPGPVSYVDVDTHTLSLASGIVHIADNTVTLFTSGLLEAQLPTSPSAATVQEFDRLAHALFATLGGPAEPDA